MACRCDDLKRMRNDKKILKDMTWYSDKLPTYNATVTEDLAHIAVASDASFFTEAGFSQKVIDLNKNAETDINTLKADIDGKLEEINNLIDSAHAEDVQYHWEQFLSLFKIG